MAVTTLTLANLAASEFQDTSNGNSAVSIKASGGSLVLLDLDNTANVAVSYCKLFDTAAAVTVGVTVPDWVIKVPASKRIVLAFVAGSDNTFANGLQVATVTAGGTAGNTSPSSAFIIRAVFN